MNDLLRVFSLVLATQVVFMCGIYFTGGLLLPQLLGGFYAATTSFVRLCIALLLAFSSGNFIAAYTYANYPPALTAPVTIFVIVLVQIAFAVMIFSLKPSYWLIPATLATAAGCLWVSHLLNAATPR